MIYNGLSPNGEWDEVISWTMLIEFLVVWLDISWRLVSAYRYYLRFDHPVGTFDPGISGVVDLRFPGGFALITK